MITYTLSSTRFLKLRKQTVKLETQLLWKQNSLSQRSWKGLQGTLLLSLFQTVLTSVTKISFVLERTSFFYLPFLYTKCHTCYGNLRNDCQRNSPCLLSVITREVSNIVHTKYKVLELMEKKLPEYCHLLVFRYQSECLKGNRETCCEAWTRSSEVPTKQLTFQ